MATSYPEASVQVPFKGWQGFDCIYRISLRLTD